MAGRSSANASSAVSPSSRSPLRCPLRQPATTAPAAACGSTPTLAQVSVGQARWSPPPAGPRPRPRRGAGWRAPPGRGRARAGSPACAAAAQPPRRARRTRPAPPAGRARRWSRRWPRPPLCRVTPPRERDLRQRAGRAARVGPGPVGTGPTRPPPWPPGNVAPLMVTVTEPGIGSIGRSPNLCRFSPSSSTSRPGRVAWRTASPRRGWRRRPSRRCAGCARRPSSGRSAACRRCP